MRTVPEWIADHDDQAIPARVKARILLRYNGRCALTGIKRKPGDPRLGYCGLAGATR